MSTNHTRIPIIGLDIGKNVHQMSTFSADDLSELAPSRKLHTHQGGYTAFRTHLNDLLKQYSEVWIGHEPTAVYYQNWATHIHQDYATALDCGQLKYYFVNPHQVALARRTLAQGRRRKTDAIDCAAIAYCLQQGRIRPAYLPTGVALQFKYWGQRVRELNKEQRRLTRSILAQLDQLWPGLHVNVKAFKKTHPELSAPDPLIMSKPLDRVLVRTLLTHYPNPYELRDKSIVELITLLREHMRCGEKTARKVFASLRQALLPDPTIAQLLTERVRDHWFRYQVLDAQLAALKTEAESLVAASPAQVLVDIPGLSVYFVACYMGGVHDARRFAHADHIWAYAGFDPDYSQSGDSSRVGQISKKGDAGLRDTLYQMGHHTKGNIPAMQAAYQRHKQRHQSEVGATLHVAHKTNRLCYRLLIDQVPYDPARQR